jgi:hypothetical protein
MSTTVPQHEVPQHEHAVADLPSPVGISPRGVGRYEFMALLLPGIFERKVMNLIKETDATVKEYSEELVRLKMGRTLLFVRNKLVGDVKVAVTIRLQRETPCPNAMTHVVVEIHRRERQNSKLFERRCNQIVRTIQACFVGQNLQPID